MLLDGIGCNGDRIGSTQATRKRDDLVAPIASRSVRNAERVRGASDRNSSEPVDSCIVQVEVGVRCRAPGSRLFTVGDLLDLVV